MRTSSYLLQGRGPQGARLPAKLTSLTIFFPCYNDAGTIGSLVAAADTVAAEFTTDYEIVVVDDGSRDSSRDLLFWFFGAQTGMLYSRLQIVLYTAYYLAIMLLAAAAVWILRNRPGSTEALTTLAAAIVSIWFMQSLFYVEIRHRWGVEPLVLLFSAAGISGLWSLIAPRRPTG